jgi:hypothetical protein
MFRSRQTSSTGRGAPRPAPARPPGQKKTILRRYLWRNYRGFAAMALYFGRRITVPGWTVLGGMLVAATLGADTNSSQSYQTFAFLGCLALVSAFCVPWGRPRVSVKRILPKFGSVGQRLNYRIMVRSQTRRRQSGLTLIDELPDPSPTFEEFALTPEPGEERRNWIDRAYGYYRWRWLRERNQRARMSELAVPDLHPRAEGAIAAELIPLRRGVLQFAATSVAHPDPFGLFRSVRRIPAPQSVLILPKRHPMPPFELPGTMKYQAGGVLLASSVGESEEFFSLREYRPGDSLRKMHWKGYAKLGKPIIKEHQDEFFVRHALILDTFGGAESAEIFEEAVSVAASLAYTIRNQDSLLDLMFVGPQAFRFTSGRNVGQIEQLLEILASVQVCREKSFDSLENLVMAHARDLSGCLCVLLAWDEPRQRLVRSLLAWGVPLRVLVLARPGEDLPPGVMAAQPNHFHVLPAGQVAARLATL